MPARRYRRPYHDYIDRFGLRSLAILPFPVRDPIRGVVTVTREGDAEPFDTDDIATIETCIEHTSLALERVVRFDAERFAREQLHAVLEGLPVGILAADGHGALALVNSAAAQLIPGISTAQNLDEVFHVDRWSSLDGSPITGTEPVFGTTQLRAPVRTDLLLHAASAEAPRVIAVSAVPLRDGAQRLAGSVTILEDVSAERAIAAEREAHGPLPGGIARDRRA